MPVRTVLCVLSCMVLLGLAGCHEDGELSLSSLPRPNGPGTYFVNVSLGPSALGMAGTFLGMADHQTAEIGKALQGLKQVRIHRHKLAADSPDQAAGIADLRRQLSGPGWSALLQTHDRNTGEDVDVYLAQRGEVVKGVAVLVVSPRELTVVNVVGPIDPKAVSALVKMFLQGDKGGAPGKVQWE